MDNTSPFSQENSLNSWTCPTCGHINENIDDVQCKECGSFRNVPTTKEDAIEEFIPSALPAQQRVKEHYSLWRILAWVGLFALLVVVAMVLFRRQQGPIVIGQKPPSFSLTTFDGKIIGPPEIAGKVILVNFWASWCKPCEQEAADLQAAWLYYQSRGDVLFLGIAWTDTESASLAYLKKFNITYPNGPDLGTTISQAYRITGVPETYIIDKKGNLASLKLSPYTSLSEIKDAIDPLLSP